MSPVMDGCFDCRQTTAANRCVRHATPARYDEAEERETAWRAWNEVPEGAALIPPGEPCPICGPKGHGLHEDDSYGGCVTCREYVAHTDDVTHPVQFPCAAARLAASPGARHDVPDLEVERLARALHEARVCDNWSPGYGYLDANDQYRDDHGPAEHTEAPRIAAEYARPPVLVPHDEPTREDIEVMP